MFYWSLINMENHQMYTLTGIQLLAVANVKNLRNEKSCELFSDVIENLNKLNGDGLDLDINGETKTYNGFLCFFLGDTPALNWLGGFKESVSKAEKFCRTCEIIHGDFMFNDSNITLRNLNDHKNRLRSLKNTKTLKENIELSKVYGVNSESPLLKIENFDVCTCLLQDPMHILYEGICHIELKCLLNTLINEEKVFSFEFLNNQIKTFK